MVEQMKQWMLDKYHDLSYMHFNDLVERYGYQYACKLMPKFAIDPQEIELLLELDLSNFAEAVGEVLESLEDLGVEFSHVVTQFGDGIVVEDGE